MMLKAITLWQHCAWRCIVKMKLFVKILLKIILFC